MATHRLQSPLTESDARSLHAGDMVYLDGEIVITAGLPAHDRVLQYLDEDRELPIDLHGGAMFHLGSYSRDTGHSFEVLYMNPTTSTRFNGHMPRLIRAFGLHAVGGKGGLDGACADAMQEVGCVYLSFLGGGCTLLSRAIKEVISVDWEDLIAHYRLVRLRVENLGPLTVGIDAHGQSLYDGLLEAAHAKMPAILEQLREARQG